MNNPSACISIDTASAARKYPVHRFARDAMACTFELYLVEQDAKYARQAAEAAFDELDRLESELSRFIPTSDIARINAAAPGQPVRASVETIACLELAAQLYVDTEGAFDVTFRSPRAESTPPPLILDPTSHAVGVQAVDVVVDLGGLGKGYALDCMVGLLREWSIGAALVHAGQSTAYALGRPSEETGWQVGLRNSADQTQALGRLELCDRAISGSGQLLHGGHIIDPRTGRPADARRAAWSLAPTAALADALSTAFMVMSSDEIERLCGRRSDVSAILLPEASEGQKVACLGAHIDLS